MILSTTRMIAVLSTFNLAFSSCSLKVSGIIYNTTQQKCITRLRPHLKVFCETGLTFKVLIHPFAGFWLRDTRPCVNNSPCCNFHGTFNGIGITAPAIECTSVLLSCSVPCNTASVVAIGNNKLTFTGTFRNNELFTVNFDCAFVHDIVSILCPATYRLSGLSAYISKVV